MGWSDTKPMLYWLRSSSSNGLVDVFDAVFFGDFPEGGSGFLGEALQDAAAVAAAERGIENRME